MNAYRVHQSVLFARLCCFGVHDNILFTRLCASHDDDNALFAGPQGPHVAQVPFLPRKTNAKCKKKSTTTKEPIWRNIALRGRGTHLMLKCVSLPRGLREPRVRLLNNKY